MRDYKRLDKFLDQRALEIYPEPNGNLAVGITKKMIPQIFELYNIMPGARVLDVGCGNGFALEIFRQMGCAPVGVCFGSDAEECRSKGFEIVETDMSFLNFEESRFDLIWCRHVLEHSILPYFTLCEMHRILKPGGVFYIEVPAPGTSSSHETNLNHYSVLTKKMWESLILRAGFKISRPNTISFRTPEGPDEYYAFDGVRE